ncbi:phospholipase D family protein [Acidiphilium sp.]|uniref:phospholipase D family protein n=1 Tax=Acidiphilium sp. TaxID=527 RepID=UPI003CFBEC81
MAKFLNTSGLNYHLEELIKGARDRLVLISPFLRLNDRIKELIADKNRLKIDVRIVYGKSELAPAEIDWLRGMTFVRTSFCKNLHAKCYLNEERCIITSLNLYEFSMVNNNEMGILLDRSEDPVVYRDAYDEAQRIVRISEEIRITLERVENDGRDADGNDQKADGTSAPETERQAISQTGAYDKLTTAKLAAQLGMSTQDLFDRLVDTGLVEKKGEKYFVTEAGRAAGGRWMPGRTGGGYILWPHAMTVGARACAA